ELGFLNDRVLLNTTYYRNRTSNTLLDISLPIIAGYEGVLQNFQATIQNYGWEVNLSSELIKRKDFSWSASFNITIPKNKLIRFPGLDSSTVKNEYIIGQSLGLYKTWQFHEVDPNTGLYLVKDRNGDITSKPDRMLDATMLYNFDPKFYGGLNNTFTYKNIQFDFLWQFTNQLGFQINELSTTAGRMNVAGSVALGNQTSDVMNRWRKTGDITMYQKFSTRSAVLSATHPGNRSIENTSFLRLKNISLSYSMPKKIISKLGLQNFRIFSLAQNLLTFTKYKGLDPETMNIMNLPPLRVITIGFQATF
ncbi:MAG: TonB-dependent receptor, partial [Chitinophagaceae bacterium]|nr:TonB-dependent receptor [Chitinophagaceae bacterium]